MSDKRTYFEIYKKHFENYFEFFEIGNINSFPGLDGLNKKLALQEQIKSELIDLKLESSEFLTILISFQQVEKKHARDNEAMVISDFIENVLPELKREFSISKSNFKPNIILIYEEPINFNTYVLASLAKYNAKKAHLDKIEIEIGLVNNSMQKLIDMLHHLSDKKKDYIRNYSNRTPKGVAALVVALDLEIFKPQKEFLEALKDAYNLNIGRQNFFQNYVQPYIDRQHNDSRYSEIQRIKSELI